MTPDTARPTPLPSAAVPDPADVEKVARADWGKTTHERLRRSAAAAIAALAAVRPSPDSEAVAKSPCPTCVREGGPYRCCPHCADDPAAHENGQRNHHDLPCSLCVVTALGTGDREEQ